MLGGIIMKGIHMIAYLLLWIGGLNWALVGLFNFNLVSALFGGIPMLEKLVYVLVGLSAIYSLATHKGDCKVCSGK